MKIAIYSDLHVEMASPQVRGQEHLDADVIVLAGDIHSPGRLAPTWAKKAFSNKTVLFTPGNHEYYHGCIEEEDHCMRVVAAEVGINILQCDSLILDDVRFIGCTLWTDLELPVWCDETQSWEVDSILAQMKLLNSMNDFRLIWTRRGQFKPVDMLQLHLEHRQWLEKELAKPFNGKTIVITHHAPHSGSVPQRYQASWLSPGFASQLPSHLFDKVNLWVHGHTHDSFDYQIGSCRVVCNPRGYPRSKNPNGFENIKWCHLGHQIEI